MSTESDLRRAMEAGLIDEAQFTRIVAWLNAAIPEDAHSAPAARFDATHVLWYGGALIVMGAMGLFSTTAFALMGGWGLFATGLAYAVGLIAAGRHLWHARNLRIPGGLLIAAAVAMVPLMIFGIQDALDLWKYAQGDPGNYNRFFPYVHGSWLFMEIGTVIAAAVALRFYKVPFLLLVAGAALWFMSMDLAMWFTATPESYDDFETRRRVSLYFGLAVIAVAWGLDLRRPKGPDLGFWLHIFGIAAFWGGLTLSPESTAFTRFLYGLVNVALVGFALYMDRRVYAVFGALGISSYLGYLAYDVFEDSLMFPFALSLIGLGVIALGLWLNRHYAAISAAFDRNMPIVLARLRPRRISAG